MDNALNKQNTSLRQPTGGILPWLAQARQKVRMQAAYLRMRMDGNKYAATQSGDILPVRMFEDRTALYSNTTGFPTVFQHNMVHNIKLAARVLNGIVIRPGETFSFWMLVRHADRTEKYREQNTAPGHGLELMSDALYWAFMHSPLEIVERHSYDVKECPDAGSQYIIGVEALVSEGMKDLKIYNPTKYSYQLKISITDTELVVSLCTDDEQPPRYRLYNGDIIYCVQDGVVWEYAPVCRIIYDGNQARRELVYVDSCRIGYELPQDIDVVQEEHLLAS